MPTEYDPFARGPFPVGVITFEALDTFRARLFPCEVWYPASAQHKAEDLVHATQDSFSLTANVSRRQMAVRDASPEPGNYPLIVYSHGGGRWHRRAATFLCTHLSSHGYVVAALDHSEVVAKELAPQANESDEQKAARVEACMASRVPDVQFLLDHLLGGTAALPPGVQLDAVETGIVGHSFGGWTALAAAETDKRIRAIVAHAPGGSSQPKPGILPAKLTFAWGRDVPTLYLAAENDCMTPLPGLYELFDRTQGSKRMIILRRADHLHFLDGVEEEHELTRTMTWTGKLSWIPDEMRPIAELCSGEEANSFVRALTLCHMDAVLKQRLQAINFLDGDVQSELTKRGLATIVHNP